MTYDHESAMAKMQATEAADKAKALAELERLTGKYEVIERFQPVTGIDVDGVWVPRNVAWRVANTSRADAWLASERTANTTTGLTTEMGRALATSGLALTARSVVNLYGTKALRDIVGVPADAYCRDDDGEFAEDSPYV